MVCIVGQEALRVAISIFIPWYIDVVLKNDETSVQSVKRFTEVCNNL